MYKTIIIEDDLLSAEALKDTILDSFPNYEVSHVFTSLNQALANLPNIEFDLMLLDMELGDGLGFDILSHIEEINFEVIITTMHNTFMLEAIKHAALDYLIKPILKQDLVIALERFETKYAKLNSVKNVKKQLSRLVIPNQSGFVIIEIKDIVRLESDGAYTKFFMFNGTSYLASKNLGFYEEQLLYSNFFRIHHKHLVNISHLTNYNRAEATVLLSDGSLVEVSRRKKDEFLRNLED